MENVQDKTVTIRAEWEQPTLNKLSLKDAQAGSASSFDGPGFS